MRGSARFVALWTQFVAPRDHVILTNLNAGLTFVLGDTGKGWRVAGLDYKECLEARQAMAFAEVDKTADEDVEKISSAPKGNDVLWPTYYWKKLTNFVERYPDRESAQRAKRAMAEAKKTWTATQAPISVEKAWVSRPNSYETRVHTVLRNTSDKPATEARLAFRYFDDDGDPVLPAYGDATQLGRTSEKIAPGKTAGGEDSYWKLDARYSRDPTAVKAIVIEVHFGDGTKWEHPMGEAPLLDEPEMWAAR